MPCPGPPLLGRSVVVDAGDPVPRAWSGLPEVAIDEQALADPAPVCGALHRAWLTRSPIVVRLGVDPARFRAPASHPAEPWALSPAFECWDDRLHFLLWANSYDARGGKDPVWWWARRAARLGAVETAAHDALGDVIVGGDGTVGDGGGLPTPAWVDGGPRQHLVIDGARILHRETVDGGRLALQPIVLPALSPAVSLGVDQLEAVTHAVGPARVVAPAGSGKTRVLTERLRHLLGDRKWETGGVVAVAYNKKAQEELAQRCDAFGPRVVTLNALGYDLLGRHRGRRPEVLDERSVRDLVEQLVPRQQRRANVDPIGPYLEALGAIRLGLRDPEQVEADRDDVPGVAAAFDPYRSALSRRGVVDYDDQIYGAIEALLVDGAFRRAEQARFRHLVVDEFQDLTPAHVLLVRLLATPELDVFGVGDDDQVIYGHAGADPRFLVDFDRYFPAAAALELEVNHRCPVAVVDGARHLLGYNRLRVAKTMRPAPDAVTDPAALHVVRHATSDGARTLAASVQRWLADGAGVADVAVLSRVQSLLLAPHVALTEAGVPVDSVVGVDLLNRTGVRAALAYLRIASRPDGFAPADVHEILRRPSRGLPVWIEKWIRGRHVTVDDIAAISDRIDDAKVVPKVLALAHDLRAVVETARGGATTRELLAVIRDVVGLGGAMSLLDARMTGGGSTHLDDLEALAQVADLHPDPATYESWLRDRLRSGPAGEGVTLSTVHRVKGREWPYVAVFGVTDGLVPHRLSEDVEEERRVLHVAITRGRSQVIVLADASRPSPFLDELTGAASSPYRRKADSSLFGVPTSAAAATGGRRSGGRASAAGGAMAALEGDDLRRYGRLKAWRTARSKSDGVPAYVVLNDNYLRGVAAAAPATLAELARLPGIGPAKLERYGDDILAIIEADTS